MWSVLGSYTTSTTNMHHKDFTYLHLVPQPSDQFFLVVVVVVKCLGLFFPRMALVGELGHLQCQVVHLLLLLVGMGVVGVVVLQQRGQFILDMLVVAQQLLVLGHHLLWQGCRFF